MADPNCPQQHELVDYSLGRLSDERSDQIDAHVEACQTCRQVLLETVEPSDTLADALRRPREVNPYENETHLREVLALVQAFGCSPVRTTSDGPSAALVPQNDLEELGQYQLLAKLGEGGMGAVYKALHTMLDKFVAVKVLPADRTQDKQAVARFQQEMRAVGKLEHPNIVRAMDANVHDETSYLVMEYVDGVDLSELIQRIGPLPIADACELIRLAAIGVQHAHEHGLVHRDIKPSNLMITMQGELKILDLGLARLHNGHRAGLTTTGQMMGTIDYMAPEQTGDSHDVDIRADIYGLGATLFKLLTDRAPYANEGLKSLIQKLNALATQPVPSVRDHRNEVPEELAAIVTKMLAKEASERYATPQEVADALTPVAQGCDLAALVARVNEPSTANNETIQPSVGSTKQYRAAPLTKTASTPAEESHRHSDTPEHAAAIPLSRSSDSEPGPPLQLTDSQLPTARTAERRRRSKKIGAMLTGIVALFVALAVIVIQTDRGDIKVVSYDPDIKVTIKCNGEVVDGFQVRQRDGATSYFSGNYRIELNGVKSDGIRIKNERFQLTRGKDVLVEITREQQVASAHPAQPTDIHAQLPASRGNFALEFDGESYVEVPTVFRKHNSREPFTIEAWVRPFHKMAHESVILHGFGFGFIQRAARSHDGEWRIAWRGGRNLENGKQFLHLDYSVDETQVNQRVHVAALWDGDKMNLYINGKRPPGQTTRVSTEIAMPQHTLLIGAAWPRDVKARWLFFDGTIDEVRISKVVRYTQDFTPATRFETDNDTIALYHFDEGQGDVLHDASANGHHGKIVGANWIREPTEESSYAEGLADEPSPDQPRDAVNRLAAEWQPGPADNVLPGLVLRPARFEGIARWQATTVTPRSGATSIAASPDGSLFACGHGDGEIRVYESSTLQLLHVLSAHKLSIRALAWSADGQWLASGGEDSVLRIWTRDGSLHNEITGCRGVFQGIAWISGSGLVTTDSDSGQGGDLRRCNIHEQQSVVLAGTERSSERNQSLGRVVWLPVRKLIVAGSTDGRIRIWNEEGRLESSFEAVEAPPTALQVACNAQESMLAIACETRNSVQIVDLEGQLLAEISRESIGGVHSLAWEPDGERLLVGWEYGEIALYDATGEKLNQVSTVKGNRTLCDWVGNNDTLVAAGHPSIVSLWNCHGDQLIERRTAGVSTPAVLAVNPHDGMIATADAESVRFWSEQGKRLPQSITTPPWVSDIAWSPDGRILAVADAYEPTVRFWDRAGSSVVRTLNTGKPLKGLDWKGSDGRLAGANAESVFIWNRDGSLVKRIDGEPTGSGQVRWSIDGKRLAKIFKRGVLKVWSADGDEMQSLDTDAPDVLSHIAWHRNGSQLIGGSGSSIGLWDLDAGSFNLWTHFDAHPGRATFYSGFAVDAELDRFAVASSSTGRVLIWKLSGKFDRTLEIQQGWLLGIAWNDPASQLIAISEDQSIAAWDTTTWEPLWRAVQLPGDRTVTLSAAGAILGGDLDVVEDHLLYIVEHEDGRRDTLKPSEFQKLIKRPLQIENRATQQAASTDGADVPGAAPKVSITGNGGVIEPRGEKLTREQQDFVDAATALPVAERLMAVTERLKRINPSYDGKFGHSTTDGHVTTVTITGDEVREIWPLLAFPKLRKLNCSRTSITKLDSVGRMTRLVSLDCSRTQVDEIGPLAALNQLQRLDCRATNVHNLTPLTGLPLTELNCFGVTPYNETAVAVVKSLVRLEALNGLSPTDWLARRDRVEQLRKTAAAFAPDKRLERVIALLQEFNPGYDGSPWTHEITDGEIVGLDLKNTTSLTDLSPLRGLKLRWLKVTGRGVADLAPLKDMPLTRLDCSATAVADLEPLIAMPLEELNCTSSRVVDLEPLKGMPLKELYCSMSRVADLSPLKGMPLSKLSIGSTRVTDLAPLKNMPLTRFDCGSTAVADLSPLRGMPLTNLQLLGTSITDLSPLEEMPLRTLSLSYCRQLSDLSPLRGLPLTSIDFSKTSVADLSPLRGMQFTNLDIGQTQVTDLSPLRGMPLTKLHCFAADISDLSPLEGMPLKELLVHYTGVADISPIQGLPLILFDCSGSRVSDLSPLKDMKLESLDCRATFVSDLSPLKRMPLKTFGGDFRLYHAPDEVVVRSLASIEELILRNPSPEDFFRQQESRREASAEFVQSLAGHVAADRVKAVHAKLRELNKNLPKELDARIEEDHVVELTVDLDASDGYVYHDLTPLRAFTRLRQLTLLGGHHFHQDISPINSLPLEELNCTPEIALRHGPVLRSMKTLKTVNGIPLGELTDERLLNMIESDSE